MTDAHTSHALDNTLGTDGIEFVEFATTDPAGLGQLLQAMGFHCAARHRSKQVLLYRQGDINFIVNAEPDGPARHQPRRHAICAIALRVRDARLATTRVRELGGWEVTMPTGVMELHIPAFQGVGGSLIYLVDRYQELSIYDVDFIRLPPRDHADAALTTISELIQDVPATRLQEWQDFYQHLFGFQAHPARPDTLALHSACGKIRIRLQGRDQATDTPGEGLSGVQLASSDLARSSAALSAGGLQLERQQQVMYVYPARADDALPDFEITGLAQG